MALRTDTYYRALAEDALKQAGLTEPPVAIESLAAHFGIPLRKVALPDFFRGAVVYEDGLPVILLNRREQEELRRQALAHMIGHILIVLSEPESGFPRNAQPQHTAADTVADELILPRFMVTEQSQKWFNDYRYLARLFGVSENDMMKKMLDMGILHQRGILWDY